MIDFIRQIDIKYMFDKSTDKITTSFYMHIIVSGKHFNIGESLRTYTAEVVQKHIKKHFENAIHAHVTFSKEAKEFYTTIVVNEGTGTQIVIKSDAHDEDAYRSMEKAVRQMEKQLEKYKERIKNHKKTKYDALSVEARKYILPIDNDGMHTEQELPTIIAEKKIDVNIMSVKDAVMYMELRNMQALSFVNSTNNKLSFVYHRKDGNIGWLDTGVDAQL